MSDEATTEETAPEEETEKKSPPKPRSKKRPAKSKKPAAKKAPAKKAAAKKATKKRATKKATAGSASKPQFLGFEEPPRIPKPNGATWKTRLPVLDEHYKGQWVKYGPFDTNKVKTSITTLEKNAENLGLTVEHDNRVEREGAVLYVRVV